jgi:hypothetical protein
MQAAGFAAQPGPSLENRTPATANPLTKRTISCRIRSIPQVSLRRQSWKALLSLSAHDYSNRYEQVPKKFKAIGMMIPRPSKAASTGGCCLQALHRPGLTLSARSA